MTTLVLDRDRETSRDPRSTALAGLKRTLWFAAALGYAVIMTGCAGMTVRPVPDDAADQCARGFRYYESAPFILVYSDGKPGLRSKLLHLPDLSRKMSIRPYERLASSTANLTFVNGVLTRAKATGDGTELPKAVIEAAKTAAERLAALRKEKSDRVQVPIPQLFKLVVDGDGTRLIPASGPSSPSPIYVDR